MKNKFLILVTAAVLAAPAVFAADNSSAPPPRGRILQRMANKLNLTADQRAQIRAVLAGEKGALKPLVAALHDARKNLRAAIHASDANETTVRAASAKVAAAQADLAVERMKLYGKIAPILTEAQRRQLADLQAQADNFADNAIARIGSGLDE